MSVRFTILGSGSGGNCAYLESDETRVLIDAGFSGRQIRQRLASIGRTPESLDGVVLTHEHSDHTQGLKVLCSKLDVPVYCNRLTREAVEDQIGVRINARLFGTGSRFEVGDFAVDTFSVPHDAYDPVGFVIHTVGGRIGFLTDLGHATKMIQHRVQEANVLVLEANYDERLLQNDTRRPWATKQRIMSRHGHLSNADAARLAGEVASDRMQRIYLGHLSRDCNTPDLARKAVEAQLRETGATHVRVCDTSQAAPCDTFELRADAPCAAGDSSAA